MGRTTRLWANLASLSTRPSRALRVLAKPSWAWVALASLAGAITLLPGVAMATAVKGKTTGLHKLMNPVWNEAKEPSANRYTWREPSPTVRAEFRSLYAHAPKEVCIAAIGGAPQTGTTTLAYRIGGGRTSPVTLVVAPGTTIEFQNRDPFPHKPYIVNEKTFVAAEMKGASNRQWKVPGPGKYELRDELAPSIRSWIVVDPNVVAVSFPQRDGSFEFRNLPVGEYTLKAFFNGEAVGKPLAVKVASESPLPLDLKEALVAFDEQAQGAKK